MTTISLLFGEQEKVEIQVEDPEGTQILLKVPASTSGPVSAEPWAQLLINQDRSFWIEQKAEEMPAEIVKSSGSKVSRLVKGQIARLESGDLIGFGKNFVRFNLEGSTVVLSGLQSKKS